MNQALLLAGDFYTYSKSTVAVPQFSNRAVFCKFPEGAKPAHRTKFSIKNPVTNMAETTSRVYSSQNLQHDASNLDDGFRIIDTDDAIILCPLEERPSDQEFLLFFLPGALKAAESYLPLVTKIHERTRLRMWTSILKFAKNIPSEDGILSGYKNVLDKVKKIGFIAKSSQNKNIFLAGHSLGSWFGRQHALSLSDAFIQIGCTFDRTLDNIHQFPKPVLTVIGERDGQIPPTTLASPAFEVSTAQEFLGEYNTVAVKPFVIVKGTNHADTVDGLINFQRGDMESKIPIDKGQEEIALIVSSFLEIQGSGSEQGITKSSALASFNILKERVVWSHQWLKPLGNAEKQNRTNIESIVNLILPKCYGLTPFITFHDFKQNFVYSKPAVDLKRRLFLAQAWLEPQGKYKDTHTLWLKLKSDEYLKDVFDQSLGEASEQKVVRSEETTSGDPGMNLCNYESLGASINAFVFKKALSKVHPRAKDKFESLGKNVKFAPDLDVLNALDWVKSDVLIEVVQEGEQEVIRICSPTYHTPTKSSMGPRYSGMHYVKVLTEARVIEWLMVDCQR